MTTVEQRASSIFGLKISGALRPRSQRLMPAHRVSTARYRTDLGGQPGPPQGVAGQRQAEQKAVTAPVSAALGSRAGRAKHFGAQAQPARRACAVPPGSGGGRGAEGSGARGGAARRAAIRARLAEGTCRRRGRRDGVLDDLAGRRVSAGSERRRVRPSRPVPFRGFPWKGAAGGRRRTSSAPERARVGRGRPGAARGRRGAAAFSAGSERPRLATPNPSAYRNAEHRFCPRPSAERGGGSGARLAAAAQRAPELLAARAGRPWGRERSAVTVRGERRS